ncbi:unnamed protein product [Cyprideis torosa]|uniref:Uncharacterized protein n=1 Tax=Cyprideis torosa TaxID=163714 RepID=A0A7R8ZL62_9CRUS|nr:unnamed protein product [Cyprideis torosa]CAG0892672.1 unnamed protein product [Cyprideis torosa]
MYGWVRSDYDWTKAYTPRNSRLSALPSKEDHPEEDCDNHSSSTPSSAEIETTRGAAPLRPPRVPLASSFLSRDSASFLARDPAPFLCREPSPPPSHLMASHSARRARESASLSRLERRREASGSSQVEFTSEKATSEDRARRRAIKLLVANESAFASLMSFGVQRYVIPLRANIKLLTVPDHKTLFQNAEDFPMASNDLVKFLKEDLSRTGGRNAGFILHKESERLSRLYRTYLCEVKKGESVLARKLKDKKFQRFLSEPPIPRRKPDLNTFVHKPFEHLRRLLLSMLCVQRFTSPTAGDAVKLQEAIQKVRPFKLEMPGRKWIFGGQLYKIIGRLIKDYWVMLFSDVLLITQLNRDRVIFVMEEPIPLTRIEEVVFSKKKKALEFRIFLEPSPSQGPPACLWMRKQRGKCYTFKAPSVELKFMWQNMLQRQIFTAKNPHMSTSYSVQSLSSSVRSLSLENLVGGSSSGSMSEVSDPTEDELDLSPSPPPLPLFPLGTSPTHRSDHLISRKNGGTPPSPHLLSHRRGDHHLATSGPPASAESSSVPLSRSQPASPKNAQTASPLPKAPLRRSPGITRRKKWALLGLRDKGCSTVAPAEGEEGESVPAGPSSVEEGWGPEALSVIEEASGSEAEENEVVSVFSFHSEGADGEQEAEKDGVLSLRGPGDGRENGEDDTPTGTDDGEVTETSTTTRESRSIFQQEWSTTLSEEEVMKECSLLMSQMTPPLVPKLGGGYANVRRRGVPRTSPSHSLEMRLARPPSAHRRRGKRSRAVSWGSCEDEELLKDYPELAAYSKQYWLKRSLCPKHLLEVLQARWPGICPPPLEDIHRRRSSKGSASSRTSEEDDEDSIFEDCEFCNSERLKAAIEEKLRLSSSSSSSGVGEEEVPSSEAHPPKIDVTPDTPPPEPDWNATFGPVDEPIDLTRRRHSDYGQWRNPDPDMVPLIDALEFGGRFETLDDMVAHLNTHWNPSNLDDIDSSLTHSCSGDLAAMTKARFLENTSRRVKRAMSLETFQVLVKKWPRKKWRLEALFQKTSEEYKSLLSPATAKTKAVTVTTQVTREETKVTEEPSKTTVVIAKSVVSTMKENEVAPKGEGSAEDHQKKKEQNKSASVARDVQSSDKAVSDLRSENIMRYCGQYKEPFVLSVTSNQKNFLVNVPRFLVAVFATPTFGESNSGMSTSRNVQTAFIGIRVQCVLVSLIEHHQQIFTEDQRRLLGFVLYLFQPQNFTRFGSDTSSDSDTWSDTGYDSNTGSDSGSDSDHAALAQRLRPH